MHTVLENLLASSSQQTSSFGFGSLSFAQISVGSLTWVSIGAIAVGFALALILARIWSIKAIPKAIFTLFFVALFSSLIGSVFRYIQAAESTPPSGQWVTLVYNIKTEEEPAETSDDKDQPDKKTDDKPVNQSSDKWNEVANRILDRLQRSFPNGDFIVRGSGNNQITVSFPSGVDPSPEFVKKAMAFGGVLEFRIAASAREDLHAKLIELSKDSKSNVIVDPVSNVPIGEWIKCSNSVAALSSATLITRPDPENPSETQALVYNDKSSVNGTDLDHAFQSYDENARPAVAFQFTSAGSTKFGKLTSKYAKGKNIPDDQKNHLAIILDNELQSAPSLNEAITGGSGIISGIAPNDVAFISSLLSAGQLPIKLEPNPTAEKVGQAPERIADLGNLLVAITVLSVLFVAFLMTSFFLASRRARDEIPIAQLSPTF